MEEEDRCTLHLESTTDVKKSDKALNNCDPKTTLSNECVHGWLTNVLPGVENWAPSSESQCQGGGGGEQGAGS